MNAPFDVSGLCLESQRLILRTWKESDLSDFYEYASAAGVGEQAGWKHHESMEESCEILDVFIREKKTFALELKENGKVIGSLGLEPRAEASGLDETLSGREVGYVLSKDYWGMGLMTEAVRTVIDFCFSTLDFDYLTCGHFNRNQRSCRVVEKCGFLPLKETVFFTSLGIEEPGKLYVLYNPHKEISYV